MKNLTIFKKFKREIAVLSVILCASLFSINQLNAQEYRYLGPVNAGGIPTTTTNNAYWGTYATYINFMSQALYTSDELLAADIVPGGLINSIGFYIQYYGGVQSPAKDISVFVKETSAGTLTNVRTDVPPAVTGTITYQSANIALLQAAGWTLIGTNANTAGYPIGWNIYTGTGSYNYQGGNLQVLMLGQSSGWGGYSSNAAYYTGGANVSYYQYYDSYTTQPPTTANSSVGGLPYIRIDWAPPGLENMEVYPGNNSSFSKGDLLNPSHQLYAAAIPRFSFDMGDPPAVGGEIDGFMDENYNVTATSEPYVALTSGTTLYNSSDDGLATINCPFAIKWDNTVFPANFPMRVCANGYIALNTTATTPISYATHWSTGTAYANLIRLTTNDRFTNTSLKYATLGTAPNRRFVIEWTGLSDHSTPWRTNHSNVQVIIYENGGNTDAPAHFRIHYGTVNHSTDDNWCSYISGNNYDRVISLLPGSPLSFPKNSYNSGTPWNNSNWSGLYVENRVINFEYLPPPTEPLQHEVRYQIIGPEPSTDVVYQMVDPANPGNPYIRVTHDDAEGENYTFAYDVQRATGPYVWTTGAGADNKSIDLRDMNIVKAGRYKSQLSVKILSGLAHHEEPSVVENNFDVRVNNNLVAHSIISPTQMKDYPFTASTGIDVSYSIMNGGINPVSAFNTRLVIYAVDYDIQTGRVTVLNGGLPIDTLPGSGNISWPTSGVTTPLLTGESVVFGDMELDPWVPPHYGYFAFEVQVWYPEGSNIEDQESSDNIYPRAGSYWLIRAQYEVDPIMKRLEAPANDRFRLGEKVYFSSSIENRGLVDVAPTDSLRLRTYITDGQGNIIYENIYPVNQAGTNAGDVLVFNTDPTGELDLWEIDRTGQFTLCTEIYQWREGGTGSFITSSICKTIYVDEAMSGTYRIGQNEEYKTIRAAIDSLYRLGVNGPVEFQLVDAEYNESSEDITDRFVDAPALEFRGRIYGANANNTIKFIPSYQRQNSRASIQINLTSRTGIGMYFGSTNDSVANIYALANVQERFDKNDWVFSESYITWDGGPNRSFKITFKAPEWGTPQFRAPIYMNNANNVTIKNCIIEDGIHQAPSQQYQLPGNTYNGPDISVSPDYNINVLADPTLPSRTYSAGIVIRATAPYQERYQENYYRLDTVASHHITISNNEITKFTYGVVDLGLNYRLVSNPILIDVKDTLFGYTKYDLDKNADLMLGGSVFLNNNPNNNDTVVYIYRSDTRSTTRSYTYYKLYNIYNPSNINNVLNSYTMVIDSADGGVTRSLNNNNLIENNQIYEIYRAGIFVGNSESTIIRSNRIHGITGEVLDEYGVRKDDSVDCAGILLGGRQRDYTTGLDGFFNLNLEVYKNEISNIASNKSATGIKYEQTTVREKITAQDYLFPDAYDRTKIYSNVVWGIIANTNHTDRYGIKIFPSKRDKSVEEGAVWFPTDTLYYSTMMPDYFMSDILVANNTIIMEADEFSSTNGDYFGLYIQKANNTQVVNNAVELWDSTFGYTTNSNKFASAVFYQGPLISEANTTIDYNNYAFPNYDGSPVDAYRYVNTDITGVVLDLGYRGEFQNLRQWQNLMRADLYSGTTSFANDLIKTDELLPKLRIRTNPPVINSPLEKRGTYLVEASTDIDNISRTAADQRLDIGAQYIEGRRSNTDLELLNIYEPATYQNVRGPFRDAEYFMIDDKPVTVNVLIRNNGNGDLTNRSVRLRVYEETHIDNNRVANIHNTNYNETYYNKEAAHYNDRTEFPDMAENNTVFFEMTKYVNVVAGEGVFVDFPMDEVFRTYWELNQASNVYNIPIQFSTMYSNVTPRYRFVVDVDLTADEVPTNNSYSKYARFFVKKSRNDMLICAYNTYNTIDTVIQSNLIHHNKVTNADFVAGKLNLDTIIGAFRKLAIYQADASESPIHDFDVLDRKAWDYRNYNLSLYKTVYVSDELAIDTTFWISNGYDFTQRYFQDKYFTNNLVSFIKHNKLGEKHNLIVGSENFISDIYKNYPFLELNQPAKLDLTMNYLRVGIFLDELVDTETGNIITSFHRTPLYEMKSSMVGLPPVEVLQYSPIEYKFNGRPGTITGRALGYGMEYTISPTGWALTDETNRLTDRPPYGILYKPIDNMVGFSSIGTIYDTLTTGAGQTVGNTLEYNKVSSLAISTQLNNIVLLSFDWRHYQNLERLLVSIDNFLERNKGIDDVDPTLPLTLGEFNAIPIGKRVDMAWRTASEHNIKHFEIQRSDFNDKDNIFTAFKNIDIIEVKGDKYDNSYNKTDREVAFGKTYSYRLKFVDFNGNINYSEVKTVTIENSGFIVSEIAPNPVNSTSTISIDVSNEQSIYAAIYDLSGKELLVLANERYGAGRYTLDIDSNKLISGSYTLIIRNSNGDVVNRPFNVVK